MRSSDDTEGTQPASSNQMTRTAAGWGYRVAGSAVARAAVLGARLEALGRERLQTGGGVIVAANHVCLFDFLSTGWFVDRSGRPARFLAKASLFAVPLVGAVFRLAGQIPVKRRHSDASAALAPAEAAVRAGECVVIYPEGTLTRDPDGWPMRGRTGVVRLALATGAPVVPLAQWGGLAIWPRGRRLPRLLPRRRVRCVAGPPVDLSRFLGRPVTSELLTEATDEVMQALTGLVAQLREEEPPARRWDPATGARD